MHAQTTHCFRLLCVEATGAMQAGHDMCVNQFCVMLQMLHQAPKTNQNIIQVLFCFYF